MVLAAAAVGWSTDHLVIPALSHEPVPARVWWTSALLIMGISVLRWGTILVRGIATGRVQYRAQAETRRAVVHRYLERDPGWFRRHSPGQLLAHAVSDVDALWSPMQFAYFALGQVFMLLLALTELFVRDLVLGLVGLVLVVLVLALNILYQRLLAPRAREAQAARGAVGGVAHESIEGDPVVRSLGLGAVEDARFTVAVERLRTAELRMAAVSSVFDPLLELLPTAAVLAVLTVGAPRVGQGGSLTVGELVGVVFLLITIAIPLNVISRFLSMLPTSGAGRARVHAVLDGPDPARSGDRRLTAPQQLRVEVRDADVLRDGQRLLDGVQPRPVAGHGHGGRRLRRRGQDHTAGPGRWAGTPVGRGRALRRRRRAGPGPGDRARARGGRVADLVPVRRVDPRQPQPRRSSPHRAPYTDAQLWHALRVAAADDVVRDLPDGLDTVVGERGATLSGGQRQRICLARAILREPRLLVLDDAMSALDPRVEGVVLDGLVADTTAGAPTVLLATSRPRAVGIADQVVLLQGGRIAAAGTPEELLTVEAYRRIVTAYDHAEEVSDGVR